MERIEKQSSFYSKLGRWTAFLTFTIASLIGPLYIFTGDSNYGFFGYFFFLSAFVINLTVLIFLLIKAPKSENPKKIYKGINWMLFNIPIAILYFGIGIYFIGIMRISIQNNTGKEISELVITGCETKEINALKNGDSKTVWISITGDCRIDLHYKDSQGEPQSETIISYVTSGMGQKLTYQIGNGEKGW